MTISRDQALACITGIKQVGCDKSITTKLDRREIDDLAEAIVVASTVDVLLDLGADADPVDAGLDLIGAGFAMLASHLPPDAVANLARRLGNGANDLCGRLTFGDTLQ